MYSGSHNGTAPAHAGRAPRPLSLEDALQLVRLYGEKESPKDERAALRWLERYLTEGSPSLKEFAGVVRSLKKRQP